MGRLFSGLFVIVALAVVFAVFALPAMLASQDSSNEDYERKMAEWHVNWSAARSAEARRSLLPELDGIRRPTGSIPVLDRHRIYIQAHVIYSQSDELVAAAIEIVASQVPAGVAGQSLTCANIESASGAGGVGSNENDAIALVTDACSLFDSAVRNLSVIRAQAQNGWLEGEIRNLGR